MATRAELAAFVVRALLKDADAPLLLDSCAIADMQFRNMVHLQFVTPVPGAIEQTPFVV